MLGLSTGGKWQVIHSVDFLREFWKFKLNWKSRTKFTNLTSKDACYSDFIGSNFQSLLGGISKAGPHLQSRARYSCTTSLSSISIRCKLSCQTNYSNGFNVCHLFWDSKFYNSLIHVLTPVDNSTLSTAQSRNWTRLNDLLEPGNPDHPSCCNSDINVMNKFITYDLEMLKIHLQSYKPWVLIFKTDICYDCEQFIEEGAVIPSLYKQLLSIAYFWILFTFVKWSIRLIELAKTWHYRLIV